MKLLVNISICILLVTQANAQNRTPIDGIAAQIGDNIILKSEIESQLIQLKNTDTPITPDMRCKIIEGIMYQNLLINQAMIDSVMITDQQVDAEMENRIRVIEQQIGGREKMEQFYGKTILQIKEEFREAIRKRMLAQEMERQITLDLTVTPREVKEFYNSLPEDSIPFINTQMTFQQIVFYPEITKADKKSSKEELLDILKQVKDGMSFSTLARLYSDDVGSANQGGKIEADRGMMVAPFEATVFSLKVGEVSDIFETEYGYHIVKLLERKGDHYTCAHILKIPKFTNEALEAAAMKLDSCYQQLNAHELTWEEAVLRYSNDEETKQNKGLITNPYTGAQDWDAASLNQIDQQIYILTKNLKPGEITQPNFYENMMSRKKGVRILRLAKQTEPHKANLKQDYPLIQNAAKTVKEQKTIENWVKDKINNAYVHISAEYQNCDFNYNWVPKP